MKIISFFVLIFFYAITTFGDIINVPGDHTTIQAGIDAASNGDTVLVAENMYYENINFKGKAITVASHFILEQDTSYISKTVINGSQPNHADTGSVVLFCSCEDTTSILCGFSITGGTGTVMPPEPIIPDEGDLKAGGGIVCILSGAKICHNKVYDNSVDHDPMAFGGGISCGGLQNTKTIIIENNEVFSNSTTGTEWTKGGGIGLAVSAIVRYNKIYNNTVNGNFYHSMGGIQAGGLWSSALPDSNRKIILKGNHIFNNEVISTHTRMYIVWGGGAVVSGPEAIIVNNTIESNKISSGYASRGAGLFLRGIPDQSIIKNNILIGNQSLKGDCYGGGICAWNCSPHLINNIIAGNSAAYGGGILVNSLLKAEPLIINNTIVNNSAAVEGGGICSWNSNATILNTILWQNTSPVGPQICIDNSTTYDVTYSDIQGDWTGTGNIDVNPYFSTDTLYCLSNSSDCIDAGDPDRVDLEDPGNPGSPLWPAKGSLRSDMGAYGGYELGTHINGHINKVISELKLFQNYPNPFNPITNIEYQISSFNHVNLSIYNILGQKVTTLVNKKQPAGSYKVEWDASSFASGVYFYKLVTDKGFDRTRKLLLLK